MTTIKLKNGSGAPLAGDLVQGEPALDLTNKRLYTENSSGTVIEVGTNPGEDVTFADNRKAIFGAGSDLQIYHDGSNSYVQDAGTGNLYLRASNAIIMQSADGAETIASFHDDNLCRLYFDNAVKLATTSTGIDVTGRAAVSSGAFDVGGLQHSYGSDANSRSWWLKTDTHGYGDFALRQSTTKTGSTYETKLLIDANGNVGIGATTVDQHLHVEGAGTQAIKVETTADDYAIMQYKTSTSSLWQSFASPTDDYRIGISGTGDAITINSSLNVGIGTSSPSGPLNVHSASGDTNLYVTTGNTAASTNIFFGDSGNSTIGRIVYDHNGNYMKFRTNGSDAMRIDSSGNVLVGTTDPAIYASTSASGINLLSVGNISVSRSSNPAMDLNRISADGDIAVFRKDGSIVGSIGTVGGFTFIGSGDTGVLFDATEDAIKPRNTSTASRDAAIDLGGSGDRFKDLYLSGRVEANGVTTTAVAWQSTSNSTSSSKHMRFKNPNGNVGDIRTNGSATAYITSSDYRLKENVVAMTGATERLKQLKPSRFNFIADAHTTVDGFLAHEVQDIVPEAIAGEKDAMIDEEYEVTPAVLDDDGNVITEAVMGTRSVPDYQGIDQSKLVPLLVATIQELEARITALESN